MKKMHNKKGFSIVLAMGITLIVGMISILILELIVPFSRNIKGVENSSGAYYLSYSGIEESLWFLGQNSLGTDTSSLFTSTVTGTEYILDANTSIIPPVGKGNSEYDTDWNKFEPSTPIQLQLNTAAVNFISNAEFTFRIPDLNENGDLTDDGNLDNNDDPIINWIISGLDSSGLPVALYGKDETGNANYIRKEQVDNTSFRIGGYDGLTLNGDTCTLQSFYSNTGICSGKGVVTNHTLKLSIVDYLELTLGESIPYLEYKINFSGVSIPGRYTQINTAGKSYGYKKSFDIKVPQTSTNQAFDFTVFQ